MKKIKNSQPQTKFTGSYKKRVYNMRNIFVEKSFTKSGGETIPRPFSKISKLSLSLDE